ncbi:hypothetical protein [Virgibacillus sp. SK37]|uniref:hypothetical protein n=1 Tax=Virgibacillus sp. SK37 TaxID=403957 RepID=UPI0004D19B8D|nr:hypothetical protein [Virgibacillus sp. SK37]AIF45118.1 hypothetical protein X953_01690 [Virgibacillus sp. SK37]
MDRSRDIIKKQSPDDWVWAGTTITSLNCSKTEIDEYIEIWKKKIEKQGLDLLDLHVFTGEVKDGYDMVNIQFLIRPKEGTSGYVI